MNVQRIEASTDYLNDVLRQLFQGHGVEALVQSGRVTFPTHPRLWVNGELFRSYERIIQFDVRLGGFDGDRVLIESVAGIGTDLNAQTRCAVQVFASASFHVLLSAFFGLAPCHGTKRETWTIGGPRVVYAGPITSVFGHPPSKPDGSPDLGFYPAFIKRLQALPLSPGTHWMRIYQMRHNEAVLSNEVLLDNDRWEEMQVFMAEQPWPIAEQPYEMRVFLVVKDGE
jgi:hypothetical protein